MSYAYKGKKVEKELKKNYRYRGTKQNRPLHVKKKTISSVPFDWWTSIYQLDSGL